MCVLYVKERGGGEMERDRRQRERQRDIQRDRETEETQPAVGW